MRFLFLCGQKWYFNMTTIYIIFQVELEFENLHPYMYVLRHSYRGELYSADSAEPLRRDRISLRLRRRLILRR